ncbi:MAG: hypothetical protein IJ356_00810 [Erysipelotrichaceae bacterium]|nr:hypothetical protein [Erysipelotrichaceae bacterium]
MRRKINVCVLMFLWMSTIINICAVEEGNIQYQIIFDSHEANESEVIQEVMEVYHELTKGVKKKDCAVIVRQSLEKFKVSQSTEVDFHSGILMIKMGDGKGSKIEGDFHRIECVPEIETTSWILEVLTK